MMMRLVVAVVVRLHTVWFPRRALLSPREWFPFRWAILVPVHCRPDECYLDWDRNAGNGEMRREFGRTAALSWGGRVLDDLSRVSTTAGMSYLWILIVSPSCASLDDVSLFGVPFVLAPPPHLSHFSSYRCRPSPYSSSPTSLSHCHLDALPVFVSPLTPDAVKSFVSPGNAASGSRNCVPAHSLPPDPDSIVWDANATRYSKQRSPSWTDEWCSGVESKCRYRAVECERIWCLPVATDSISHLLSIGRTARSVVHTNPAVTFRQVRWNVALQRRPHPLLCDSGCISRRNGQPLECLRRKKNVKQERRGENRQKLPTAAVVIRSRPCPTWSAWAFVRSSNIISRCSATRGKYCRFRSSLMRVLEKFF